MKKTLFMGVVMLAVGFFATTGLCDTTKGEKINGMKEFQKHCAVCHPNGGNTINKMKPLSAKSLKSNGVVGVKGIVAKMRNPGQFMTKFDQKTISNNEASAIAEYILKTFK
jgi:cytochrome c6